jgi:hypothetical protein
VYQLRQLLKQKVRKGWIVVAAILINMGFYKKFTLQIAGFTRKKK